MIANPPVCISIAAIFLSSIAHYAGCYLGMDIIIIKILFWSCCKFL